MSDKKQSVAVLVHNDVIKDARVRKEIRTLVSNGYLVDVFGVSTESRDTNNSIEGSNSFTLIDLTETQTNLGIYYQTYQVLSKCVSFTKQRLKSVRKIVIRNKFLALSLVFSAGVISDSLTTKEISWIVMLAILIDLSTRYLAKKFHVFHRHLRYKKIAAGLFSKITKKNYDFVHCHDLIALMAGANYKTKYPGTTFIWDAHELYEEISYKDPSEKKYISKLISSIAGKIDKFITISEQFKNIYASRYPQLPSAHVVMNATWPQTTLANDFYAESPLRSSLGLGSDQKILLFQGGFSPNRGIKILLEAAAKLPDNWTIVFMGWGKLEEEIVRRGKSLNESRDGLKPAIKVIPPVSQEHLQEWTAGATLGVIPYENINMNHLYCTPNKLWEYPNSGVPILATDLVEMGNIVRTWNIGTLLPRDFNDSDILYALSSVNDQMLMEWKSNCQKFSSEMSWETFEPELLNAYE